MDELRSSDALEREIRDDSRKKAEKILRQADEDMRTIGKASQERAEREILLLKERYLQKRESFRAQTLSRLPLEKKRKRIEWAEKRLEAALSRSIAEMDGAKLLGVFLPGLARCADSFSEGGYAVRVSGFDPEAAAARLSGLLPGFSRKALESAEGARSVRVESADGRVAFSMDEQAVRDLMADKYRLELSQALLGKMEDL
jgi:V/A-type H+-transporting ATPase subunit E